MSASQWNRLQASLPPEDRTSYADYLKGQDSTPAPAPVIDSRIALAKLTSGQTLTDDEKRILGLSVGTKTATGDTGPTPKTVTKTVTNSDGTVTTYYSDGTSETTGTPKPTGKTVSKTVSNPDGTTTIYYSDGTSEIVGKASQPGLTAADVAKAVQDAVNALNTSWQARFDALQNQQRQNNQAAVSSALDDFRASLKLAGLDSLVDTIDGYIKQDMTAAQIKINLTQSPAYQQRFPGMASLQKAGMAINEATYINMERGMLNVLSAYGLDEKVLGTREKLGEVIGNQVSVAEYESRVQMAADRIKKNTDVLASLNEYYGVDTAGAMSYLLDPKLGMDIVKKQIRASEIGAAAEMYQFDLTKAQAESYINVSGTADLNALKESFGKARVLASTQGRLSSIEGEKYNELEAVATILGQDYERQLESQRRALREAARFAGQSGVSSASLKTESQI